jgi:hypothetical protein
MGDCVYNNQVILTGSAYYSPDFVVNRKIIPRKRKLRSVKRKLYWAETCPVILFYDYLKDKFTLGPTPLPYAINLPRYFIHGGKIYLAGGEIWKRKGVFKLFNTTYYGEHLNLNMIGTFSNNIKKFYTKIRFRYRRGKVRKWITKTIPPVKHIHKVVYSHLYPKKSKKKRGQKIVALLNRAGGKIIKVTLVKSSATGASVSKPSLI